ncbi:M56 family metallopeptidase [Tenacibaculum sp. M341]|uniref:M56 family metallopeptidase n=1 Tax=Tenacibaculum sp. M341 TaxID=2530339 RepID=UPI001053CF5F|nr:M56 family metallopeptidase [Tenacibaculum sp. M341]TCI85194.1 M56 family peptidase [Tenacibaculum sp. M341]
MLTYVLQVVLFQVLFLLVYDIALSKETFFTKNRLYLLSTTVTSFFIPLFKIETLNEVVSQEYTVLLPEIVLSPQKVIEKTSWYQSINYVKVFFVLGMILFAIIFFIRLFKLIRLIYNHKKSSYESYTLVLLPKNAKAFSFFNYIFIGEELTGEKKNNVIKHELVHCKQKHTLDLLLFEILKIVMWFNPMIWILQKRISLVHEFISDEVVSKSSEKNNYINNLLSEIFQVENISFVNQFYKKSLIKRRITMITKNRSKQIKNLKYLLLVPVMVSMLFYTSCSNNQKSNVAASFTKNLFIDYTANLNDMKEDLPHYKINIKNKYALNDVPLSMTGIFPTYPGCEEGDRACFNNKIKEFVIENFDFDLLVKYDSYHEIYVHFTVNKQGNIENVRTNTNYPELDKHAVNVVKRLPKMKPAIKNGKAVSVYYSLPVMYRIKQ